MVEAPRLGAGTFVDSVVDSSAWWNCTMLAQTWGHRVAVSSHSLVEGSFQAAVVEAGHRNCSCVEAS